MIIFLDESGDLGFDFNKRKTSRKFVITVLVCRNAHVISDFRRAITRTLRNKLNRKKKSGRIVIELKGTRTALEIKQYFMRHAPSEGWKIYTVILNKNRVHDRLRTAKGKKKLYNFLARFIVEKIDLSEPGTAVTLIADRCKNRQEIRDFNSYMANQLEALLPLNIPLNIYHEFSFSSVVLQAVDLFSWGIFRKYENGDMQWYGYFKEWISYETEYLR